MAGGDFLQGLSEGIFERLGEIRKEQESKDELQKKNSIAVLSEAYKNAKPGGQQEILRLMGQVIGVKGKMKGFWNAFSGMPDRTVEDQLGTTMKEFSDKLISPEEATNLRAGGDLARLFQPQTPEQETNRANRLQAEKGLQGRIEFRDQVEDELRKIKARGEVAEQVAAERAQMQAYYQGLRQEDAQRFQLEKAALLEGFRGKRKLRDEASQVAMLSGRHEPSQEDWETAAQNMHRRGELTEEALQELIHVRQATTAEKRANIKAGKATQGAERLAIAQRGEVNKIQKAHQEALGKMSKAQSDQDSLAAQIEATIKSYAPNAKFNRATGVIEGADAANAYQILGQEVKDYRNKGGEKAAAEKEASGYYTQAGRKPYGSLVKRGKTHLEPMEVVNPTETPGTPPAVPPTRGSLKNVGIGSQRPRGSRPAPALGPFDKFIRVPNPEAYTDGQIMEKNDGTKWKVTGRGKDHIRVTPYLGK